MFTFKVKQTNKFLLSKLSDPHYQNNNETGKAKRIQSD